MRKMLDAGCWMLDAGKRFYTQHSTSKAFRKINLSFLTPQG
jgi:hypothetical protein